VRLRFLQPGSLDDLALDPGRIGLARDPLDYEAKQREAVVGIFEARVGFDRRRQLEFSEQLGLVEIGPGVDELPGIGTVPGEAGTVREELRKARLCDPRMQPRYIAADRIIEPQFALFAQLHQARGGKGLGVGGDAKAMARRQLFAAVEIGTAERAL